MSTTPTIGRRVAAFLVVLVTVLGVTLFSAGSASGAVAAQPVITTDGCTLVDDDPAGVSFTRACNEHDICYGQHAGTRLDCDRDFRTNMLDICKQLRWTSNYVSCVGWAYTYYLGVRLFGLYFWNAANPAVRILTPMQG